MFVCVVMLWCGVPIVAASAPTLSSRSAVIYEPESGLVLYEKDGDTSRPMASTTKLMTALLASERLSPDTVVTVPSAALPVEGSQLGLAAGDRISVRDLLAGLLLASGNDTANVLALLMAPDLPSFAVLMNQRAAALGMTHSTFVTPSGLDEGDHSASARDMAVLGAAVLQQPLLAELCRSRTATITVNERRMTVSNHNKLLTRMTDCIGLKTGFTKRSGRCLVSAVCRDGITLVVATLNGGDYWNDHMSLYNYGFSLVKRQTLSADIPDGCRVFGGLDSIVAVETALPDSVVVRTGESLTYRVEMPPYVWAPIQSGDVLGTVAVYADTRAVCTAPLTAAGSVAAPPQPTAWQLWWRRCRQLFWILVS